MAPSLGIRYFCCCILKKQFPTCNDSFTGIALGSNHQKLPKIYTMQHTNGSALHHHQVLLNGKVSHRNLADIAAATWQERLQDAYIKKVAPVCCCQAVNSVPMCIARRDKVYVLRRNPKTGHLHHPACDSHGGISPTAAAQYNATAIQERPDGLTDHLLSVPMSTIESFDIGALDADAAPPSPSQDSPQRSTITAATAVAPPVAAAPVPRPHKLILIAGV